MKGIIIYGDPMWGDNERATYCEFINEASFELKRFSRDQIGQCGHYIWKVGEHKKIVSRLEGEASEKSKAVCSSDDTYDFETGALIALMKMCGVEKVVRAFNEAFPKETHNTYITKFENELNTLKKDFDKVRDLKDFYKKNYNERLEEIKHIKEKNAELLGAKGTLNYIKSCNESTIESLENTRDLLINKNNELIEENEKLKLDCEKLQHGYNDMIFCGGRACGKQYKSLVELFKKLDQKKVDAAYKEAYGGRVIWCSSQSSTRDMLVSLLDSCKYAIPTDNHTEWLYKIPTKREKKWERILEIRKENDVIIEVKKEDVTTFLHEIEDKIPEITWASDVKIFEAKGTIKDIYDELKTHNRIYFRLNKKNKLSYSSDLNTYLFINLDIISYLPPMRWDLFKKGRLAVKVNYNNYKEFYEACEKELGKRPVTAVFTEDFTVSICKKDGLFEIFTVEDQKKTGRKIVDWEDVR